MRVKLGFAIATAVKPDLLLIDEVLAVGDMGFTIKCLNAVRKIMLNSAVVFVSHSMPFVSDFCTRILLLTGGVAKCDTDSVPAGISSYLAEFPVAQSLAGTGDAKITNIQLGINGQFFRNSEKPILTKGHSLQVGFDLDILENVQGPLDLFMQVNSQSLQSLVSFENDFADRRLSVGHNRVVVDFGAIDLNTGEYSLVLGVSAESPRRMLARIQGIGLFQVVLDKFHWGNITRTAMISVS
jgi:lipopolysaccharide transport system ATP-binding protein